MKAFTVLAVVAGTAIASVSLPSVAADAICYNCPPEWADWASMLKAIDEQLDIQMPHDNKNSGQSLSQLIAEKAAPIADVVYYGVTSGYQAMREDVVEPYKPKHFDDIPAAMKDPEGHWFTVHYGTMGLFINKDALGKAPLPQCWADLTKPEYKGMVGYLDPSSAFVGYAGATAINLANGGSFDDFAPAIAFFQKLAKNAPIVPKQTAYARVVSGEIPILLDYDFNAYRAKYEEDGNFEFVLPCEGTISVPYVMSLVKGAPHPDAAKKVLDFVLSDAGQKIWANAYLKPVRDIEMDQEVAARFLPDADYARARDVQYDAMQRAQQAFGEQYLSQVR